MIKKFILLLTMTAQTAWADTANDLTVNGDTYTINTATGWNTFCDMLADNDKGVFDGKTVLLGADITVERMAGGSYHDFTGTFDGQGNTLTVSYGTNDSPIDEDNAAPFRNVEDGCVIKNLNVTGLVCTSKKFASGLVGTQYGTVRIENCRVSTTIHSYTADDGTHGGLVGLIGNNVNAKLTIEGCVFDGKLLTCGTTATTNCAGFVGWKSKNSTLTLSNVLFAPAALTDGETEITSGSATFVRNKAAGTSCYYTRTLGSTENQGSAATIVIPTAADYVPLAVGALVKDYGILQAYAKGLKYDGAYYLNLTEGDANVDGQLTQADCFAIVNYIIGKPSPAFSPDAADMNHDTNVSVSDALIVLKALRHQEGSPDPWGGSDPDDPYDFGAPEFEISTP